MTAFALVPESGADGMRPAQILEKANVLLAEAKDVSEVMEVRRQARLIEEYYRDRDECDEAIAVAITDQAPRRTARRRDTRSWRTRHGGG